MILDGAKMNGHKHIKEVGLFVQEFKREGELNLPDCNNRNSIILFMTCFYTFYTPYTLFVQALLIATLTQNICYNNSNSYVLKNFFPHYFDTFLQRQFDNILTSKDK